MLPPPPVKRPLHARFLVTAPVLVCTVPQFPLPMLVVKLSIVGFTPQHRFAIVVVVVLAVVVVVVGGGGVDVVVVGGGGVEVDVVPGLLVDVVVLPVVAVVLVVVTTLVVLVVTDGMDVVVVGGGGVDVVVVPGMLVDVVVVGTPGHVQSGRQSRLAPPADDGGHVGLPGGSHCSPGSRNELPHDDGRLVLDEEDDEVVTTTVVDVSVLPVVDVVTGVIVVVVVPAPQFGPLQASQQLGTLPTQALPSGGA